MSVDTYLKSVPKDRQETIAEVRAMIRKHLPKGYEEAHAWGMISYQIPLSRFPVTYNEQPLMYAALAAQKNHNALYLMCVYSDAKSEQALRDAFAKTGKKLDMGKSCIRFKTVDDLPMAAIGKLIASVPVDAYIARYEKVRAQTAEGKKAAAKGAATQAKKPKKK